MKKIWLKEKNENQSEKVPDNQNLVQSQLDISDWLTTDFKSNSVTPQTIKLLENHLYNAKLLNKNR